MGSDTGMSLVELIVYLAIAVLVTLGVATLFASGFSANTATQQRDTATGQAQLIAASLQTNIRNASSFTVTDNLLRARVAVGDNDWRCEAWAITPGRAFVHRTSTTAIPVPSDFTGWTVVADDTAGTLSSGRAFAVAPSNGKYLEVGLTVTVGEAVVPVNTGVVAQAAGEGALTC